MGFCLCWLIRQLGWAGCLLGKELEEELVLAGEVILFYQQKVWGFTGMTQDGLWVRMELDLPTASC